MLVDWAVRVDSVDFFLCGGQQLFLILARELVILVEDAAVLVGGAGVG